MIVEKEEVIMKEKEETKNEINKKKKVLINGGQPLIMKAKYFERLAEDALKRDDFKKAHEHYINAEEVYSEVIKSGPALCTIPKLRDYCHLQAESIQQLEEAVDRLTAFIKDQPKCYLPVPLSVISIQDLIDYVNENKEKYDGTDVDAHLAFIQNVISDIKKSKELK